MALVRDSTILMRCWWSGRPTLTRSQIHGTHRAGTLLMRMMMIVLFWKVIRTRLCPMLMIPRRILMSCLLSAKKGRLHAEILPIHGMIVLGFLSVQPHTNSTVSW